MNARCGSSNFRAALSALRWFCEVRRPSLLLLTLLNMSRGLGNHEARYWLSMSVYRVCLDLPVATFLFRVKLRTSRAGDGGENDRAMGGDVEDVRDLCWCKLRCQCRSAEFLRAYNSPTGGTPA